MLVLLNFYRFWLFIKALGLWFYLTWYSSKVIDKMKLQAQIEPTEMKQEKYLSFITIWKRTGNIRSSY